MSSETFHLPGARNQTDVFAVHGADPEVLAFAMAKYSRSALSMRESLTEISAQRAEQFLNTFYFQYGHRSIADLAHIAFAVERLSLLAAMCWWTSSAGTARNDRQGTRISSNPAGIFPISEGIPDRPALFRDRRKSFCSLPAHHGGCTRPAAAAHCLP